MRHPGPARGALAVALAAVFSLAPACLSQALQSGDRSLFGNTQRELHPPLVLEPLVVTGTLGEFRNHSFHYGLDFSTGGKVGASVHAVDEGHVRRVVYGRYNIGYGVWIEHPDGRTSKYGHLQSFSSRLLAHPRIAAHHQDILLRRDFSVHLPAGELAVSRGEVIARSGESGIGFAHLHFEYMQPKSQVRLDPLQAGLRLRDRTTPLLRELIVVPATPDARVNGQSTPLRLRLVPIAPPRWQSPELHVQSSSGTSDGQAHSGTRIAQANDADSAIGSLATNDRGYYLQEFRVVRPRGARSTALRGAGTLVLQLDAYDPAQPGSRSRLGLAGGELRELLSTAADSNAGASRFRFQIDRLSPALGPYHALLFDRFRTKLRGGARYLYNYYERAPGRLPFIQSDATRGRIHFAENSATGDRRFVLTATDAAGNRSQIALQFRADPAQQGSGAPDSTRVSSAELSAPGADISAGDFREGAEWLVRSGGPGTQTVTVGSGAKLASADGQAALQLKSGDHFEHLVLRLRPIARGFRRLPPGLRWWSPRAYAFERIVPGAGGRAQTSPYIDFVGALRGSLLVPAAPAGSPESFHRKLGVYRLDTRRVTPVSVPQPGGLARIAGLLDGKRAHFRTRSTGVFAALIDEAPPKIGDPARSSYGRLRRKPAEFRNKPGDAYRQSELRLFLKIEDEGAGPDYSRLEVTVDGKPAYTDHDPDRNAAEVFYPEHVRAEGSHLLEAVAYDRAGNASAKLRYRYHVLTD